MNLRMRGAEAKEIRKERWEEGCEVGLGRCVSGIALEVSSPGG
jgi:hypothetical protein